LLLQLSKLAIGVVPIPTRLPRHASNPASQR
jgi:hypothetical protein